MDADEEVLEELGLQFDIGCVDDRVDADSDSDDFFDCESEMFEEPTTVRKLVNFWETWRKAPTCGASGSGSAPTADEAAHEQKATN